MKKQRFFIGESLRDGPRELASRHTQTISPDTRLALHYGIIIEELRILNAAGYGFMRHFCVQGNTPGIQFIAQQKESGKEYSTGKGWGRLRLCDGKPKKEQQDSILFTRMKHGRRCTFYSLQNHSAWKDNGTGSKTASWSANF